MRHISTIFTVAVVLFFTSCNNQPKPAEEKPVETPKVIEVKPVFKPYKALIVQHTVKDFDKWFAAYNAHDSIRKTYGINESSVGRGLDNDKWVLVYNVATDLQKAKDFAGSANLKEVMKKAGVTGVPTLTYVDVIRDDTTTIPQKERIMVTHHVKDFDKWLKAYDAEGLATRTANGMVDRGMARSIDDPNTVILLFAVTDATKAKARMNSPELKKVMTDAGVDGPTITWFKWVTD
ncbi:MAG: hypothetical protein JWO06_3214 [Bacteroidota bacterium]|nr:hypothetical protein [Bacteroidota bacterium]